MSSVPTTVAVFLRDVNVPVWRLAEAANAIVGWAEFDCGGHFAALEEPDLMVADLRDSFRWYRTRY